MRNKKTQSKNKVRETLYVIGEVLTDAREVKTPSGKARVLQFIRFEHPSKGERMARVACNMEHADMFISPRGHQGMFKVSDELNPSSGKYEFDAIPSLDVSSD